MTLSPHLFENDLPFRSREEIAAEYGPAHHEALARLRMKVATIVRLTRLINLRPPEIAP